jgi:polyphenol oxidase
MARLRTLRSRGQKEDEKEVLIVDGIQVPTGDHSKFVEFDVFVNAPQSGVAAAAAQCAGSVTLTPHAVRPMKGKGAMRTATG